ncbi:MAG: HEAT repeat domain-containing protein [Acidobacteria bacterium]|nr:HEAT repeat domain-containing protein [Acidobacteriota bacterium]
MIPLLLLASALQTPGNLERLFDEKLNATQRNDACFALNGAHDAQTLQSMRRLLAHEKVRACAARNLRDARAIGHFHDALQDENPDVRAVAADMLGFLAAPESLPRLAEAARDTNLVVATGAVQALGQYPGSAATPHLLDLAKTRTSAGFLAIEIALRNRTPELAPIARRLLQQPDVASRLMAIRILAELGSAADLDPLRAIAATDEEISAGARGFGFLPAINLARVARGAVGQIEARLR